MEPLDRPYSLFPTLAELEYEQANYDECLQRLKDYRATQVIEDRSDGDDMLFDPDASEETERQGYEDFMKVWTTLNP